MKRLLLPLILLVFCLLAVHGVAQTSVVGNMPDSGSSLPATCSEPSLFFKFTVGLYQCVAGAWVGFGGGSGTVNSGTAGQPTYYATSTNAVNGLDISFATVTDASPIAWSLTTKPILNGTVTLNHTTGTRALNVSNLVQGGYYRLLIKQDSTGGAAMTLGTGCTWKVANGGAGAITLTSAANAIDILIFTYDGTNCYAALNSNFN